MSELDNLVQYMIGSSNQEAATTSSSPGSNNSEITRADDGNDGMVQRTTSSHREDVLVGKQADEGLALIQAMSQFLACFQPTLKLASEASTGAGQK
jgi:hypothetical protein